MLFRNGRSRIERRLTDVSRQAVTLRQEIDEVDQQLAHLREDADDARLRSLVSETPVAEREHQHAQRHVDTLAKYLAHARSELADLDQEQDDLLDRLTGSTS